MQPRRFHFIFAVLTFVFLALGHGSLKAQEPQVGATLSSNEISVGQATNLSVSVTGASVTDIPARINVDGLQITQAGQTRQFSLNNGVASSTTVYIYTVIGLREGTFTIPGIAVTAGGRALRTQDLTLNVVSSNQGTPGGRAPQASPGQPSQQGGGQQADDGNVIPEELISAELVIPSNEIYVGQPVPVEMRVYFRHDVRGGLETGPELRGDGFTSPKFQQPREQTATRNGQPYQLVTFRTTLTPVKAGKLAVGPGELSCVVAIPRRRSQRGPFGDDFFQDAFGYNQQRVTIKTDPVELNVLPLPVEKRPADFSGAVGQFELQSEVTPREGSVGDPITIRSTIKGRGDFDLLPAPVLTDKQGFREYPATSKFTPGDDLNLSGSKVFEQVVIPEQAMRQMPGVKFSYFDPIAREYRVLESPPVTIKLSGGAVAAPAPQAAPAVAPSGPGKSEAAPTPEPAGREIFHIFNDPGPVGSFVPFYKRTGFWVANGAALAAWIALLFVLALRRRRATEDVNRKAYSERLAASLRQASAHHEDEDALILALQNAAVLRKGGRPEALAADAVVDALALPPDHAELVQELFARRDARRYGGSDRQVAIDTTKIIAFLRKLK